jgi:mannosyltransferase OCH1-like enzyme
MPPYTTRSSEATISFKELEGNLRPRRESFFLNARMRVEETGGGIQKIIHQIWIGDNPVPQEWMDTVKAFADKYGYEYKLWKNVDDLGIDDIAGLRKVYNAFAKQPAGRADIIRILALYKYGGVYIDADSVIVKPEKFQHFLEKNTAAVFFGWENLSEKRTRKLRKHGGIDPVVLKTRRLVANGLIGACKGHPFMKRLLDGFVENMKIESGEGKPEVWKAVGPNYVTRVYNTTRKEFPEVHVYPMKYFYPVHWGGITDPNMHKNTRIPGQSMLFQYGYTTNSFHKVFKKRQMTRKAGRKRKE